MAGSPARSPRANGVWCILLHGASPSLEAASKNKGNPEVGEGELAGCCFLEMKEDGENGHVAEMNWRRLGRRQPPCLLADA